MVKLNKDNCSIKMYWRNSVSESGINACKNAILSTLKLLSSFSEEFRFWYDTEKPKKGVTLIPISNDEKGVEKLLLKGIYYDDVGQIMPKSGYLLFLKSQIRFEESHVLSIRCGSSNSSIPNSIVLELNSSYTLLNINDLHTLFKKLIEIWVPDNGRVSTESFENLTNQADDFDEAFEFGITNYSKEPFPNTCRDKLDVSPFMNGFIGVWKG